MAEDYLDSVESYRAYLDSLPEPSMDNMYCVEIEYEEETHTHALVTAMNDTQAIEQFDISYMMAHNDEGLGAPVSVKLVAPIVDGERREIARIADV